jgi:hypothetical protein
MLFFILLAQHFTIILESSLPGQITTTNTHDNNARVTKCKNVFFLTECVRIFRYDSKQSTPNVYVNTPLQVNRAKIGDVITERRRRKEDVCCSKLIINPFSLLLPQQAGWLVLTEMHARQRVLLQSTVLRQKETSHYFTPSKETNTASWQKSLLLTTDYTWNSDSLSVITPVQGQVTLGINPNSL